MTTTTYTRKQRDAVNGAWLTMIDACERTDTLGKGMLLDGLRQEKRERSNVHSAKALMADCFWNGFTQRYAASDLYGLSRGCLLASVVGAGLRLRGTDIRPGAEFEESRQAHREAINSALAKI